MQTQSDRNRDWGKDELLHEINTLGRLIQHAAQRDDAGAKYACAYLKQVLRDRRDDLAALEYREARAQKSAQETDRRGPLA